jgi:hypothetical protein
MLFNAQHLAVTGDLRSDRRFDRSVIGTAVDPAQHGEARGGRLNAVVTLFAGVDDSSARAIEFP